MFSKIANQINLFEIIIYYLSINMFGENLT
jgi:hypothetical protein